MVGGKTPNPGRNLSAVVVLLLMAVAAVIISISRDFPQLHSILDTAACLLSAVLAFLLWDLGWRTGQLLARLKSMCFAVVAVLEFMHVVTALDFSEAQSLSVLVRPGTFSPAAYLLPLGLLVASPLSRRNASAPLFAVALLILGAAFMALFALVPRYSPPGFLGITRPTLMFAPLLWIPVIVENWRIRDVDRLAQVFAMFAAVTLFVPLIMLFSEAPADKAAMIAHVVRVAGELVLLFSLTQMGTFDTAERMRVERALKASNEALEARVAMRTAELETANTGLRVEALTRQVAEQRAVMQLERLGLLQRITHAIAERLDLESIFQVVVRSVEQHMPADFAALCSYEHTARVLTVSRVGAGSAPLAREMAMAEQARIEIDDNGLSRCVAGKLVYEPDVAAVRFPFPQRLARGGLKSMVIVPLMVEQRSGVFGVLVVARRTVDAFSSAECEFLHQLCDHVSLAANQAQLHASLRKAYDDLQLSQNAIMQQERLRALGQMASGIAHDINNAISPITLYVDALLTHESGFSDRARKQLEIIQRAVDDVAHTVARMGEFYRQRPTQLELAPVEVNRAFRQVLELTRARWSDMAQQRGAVIETKVDSEAQSPIVMAIESELREALINLVFNATDAMVEGGTLTLRSGHALEAGKGVARRVFIEVSDTGVGMDEATRRRCLEPFFTTKGDRGSGLGLAMVYGIAQRHGADIGITSAPGEGTTFRMTFPQTSPAAQSTASIRIQKIPRHTKILLIDDDSVLLTSLREVLVHDGHQVQTASGGRVGIEMFLDAQKAGKPFPVVITDLGMPHIDGRAVAAAIKTAAPATSIIMLTGWGQRLVASGEKPEGVVAILSKPPKLSELRQCLAECTGEIAEKDSG
ncbi:MAG TPA: ATP-binding protein [Steroidobacteraceae bacterium]|jgi:signal transduction histidine kinase/ActR/RegA family two-component response regulator|nr:ATP-binding protein [Steroidobacteraceae bacterium]